MGRKKANTTVTDTGGGQPRSKSQGTNPAPRRCRCSSALPATAAPTRAPCGMRAGTELRWMRKKGTDPPSHLVGTPRSPYRWCRDHQDLSQLLRAPCPATPRGEMLKEPLWNPSLLCVFLLEKPGHIHAAVKTINTSSLTKSPILIRPATANCKIGVESRCGFSPA